MIPMITALVFSRGAEGTRILARHEVPRIRASTDLGNTPMAKAFQRAGYVNFEREIKMTWS
jgi:hypothetical protein